MTADFVREGSRHYFGMVSLIDQKIGEVLAALTMQHELENTWIIYSCDHGEMLGSHGLWAKMNLLSPFCASAAAFGATDWYDGTAI